VGPKAGLEVVEKGEIFFTCRESNPDHPARRSTVSNIPVHSSGIFMYLFVILLWFFNDLTRSRACVALNEAMDGEL
jgi:hypothetical protein